MFGRIDEITCPYCNNTYNQDFGCATYYYYINESTYAYTTCTCKSCNKSFWYSHVQGSKKKHRDDICVLACITSW